MKPDLNKLSRAEKLKLIDALEEKARRKLEQREAYIPNSGQEQVHRSRKTVRAVFSGNGGGKTALGVNEALWGALGFNPVTGKHSKAPSKGVVVLDKPEKVEQVWLTEIKKWFPLKPEQLDKMGKPYIARIRFDNGSEIRFMFHDQEPMSFESIEIDWAIFDEPPPRHIYVALRRGGRGKHSKPWFLIIGTPIAAAWLRKEIYEPWARGDTKDTECFRYGTEVNRSNLAEGYIESFASVLSEKEKRIRLQGEFFDLEGLALADLFKRETHLVAERRWPPNWPVVIAIDPHPRKAHVALMLGVSPDNELLALKEIASREVPSKFAGTLKAWYQGYRVLDIVCDSFGSSELTGGDGNLSFIQVLREQGIKVRPTRYDEKQDESWIQMIQEVLAIPVEPDGFGRREPRLKILSSLKGLIADIETVEWQKFRNFDETKPKLAIESKDFLACLKYALAAQPKFNKGHERPIKPQSSVSWNSRDKRPLRRP